LRSRLAPRLLILDPVNSHPASGTDRGQKDYGGCAAPVRTVHAMNPATERRQQEKDRRRASMLDAAEAIYAECGWDMLTVLEVARRVHLSRPLVYVYFRSKRDLHLAVVERALAQLCRRFEETQRHHRLGLDQVEAMARAFAQLALDMPHYFDACSRYHTHPAAKEDGQTHDRACLRRVASVLDVMAAAIAAGQADGSIRRDLGEPSIVALSLWGFLQGSLQLARGRATAQAEQAFALIRRMLQLSSSSN
jgi:TetR/AcrR family transcriptional regulator